MKSHSKVSDSDLITEAEAMVNALRESERCLALIYNTLNDVIFHLAVMSHDRYQFVSVNAAFLRVTGLSAEQVIGRTVNEVIPEPSLTMVLGKYRQAIENRASVQWEEISSYPAGLVTGEVTVVPVYDGEGRCIHLIGSVHDITERKRAEEALRESEARFRLLFNSGRDAIAVHLMGKDGQPTNFIQVNDVACERLGYTMEEMLKLSPQDIDAPEYSAQMPMVIDKLLKNKEVLFETEHITKDGHRIPVEISTVLFHMNDCRATMSVARDITERKSIEAEREKLIEDLQDALAQVKTLQGIIPICMYCKKIRDDKESWHRLEAYISDHTDALFSHGICPECAKEQGYDD